MSQFIETIRFQKGKAQHVAYHQQRFDDTRIKHFGKRLRAISLDKLLIFPDLDPAARYKCTVVYNKQIQSISIRPYQLKSIKKLKLVHADELGYDFKFHDRTQLTNCYGKKSSADDVMIIKNGLVTDSFYANFVFEDKNGLFTPSHPLLFGTTRTRLLEEGRITERLIHAKDLNKYDKVYLINAMIDLGEIVIDLRAKDVLVDP